MSDRTVPQDPVLSGDEESQSEPKDAEQPANPGAPALSRRERLAAAAEKRREQRQKERQQAAAVGLDAGERVDDALVRATDRMGRFVKRHFNVMQWVFVGAIAVWIGVQVFNYRKLKSEAKVGDNLGKGAHAALAPIDKDEEAVVPGMPADPRPKYDNDAARLKAAREGYEAAIALKKSEGSVLVAELGLAGLDLDEGKAAEARTRYERVKSAPYAQKDSELRGRALEGIALSYEAANDNEAAIKAYREIENSGIEGFVEMAMLAQARILVEKGDTAAAKEALDKLQKRLEKVESKAEKTFYLGPTLQALKALIAPNEPVTPEPGSMDDLQKTLQELSKKMGGSQSVQLPMQVPPEAPEAPAPEAPAPTPEAPAVPAPEAPTPGTAAPPGTPGGQDPSGGTQ